MIVVTGGAGFIGSNIVAALAALNRGDVVVSDRLGRGDKWRNLARHEIADIVPPERLLDFLDACRDEIEAVVHMGAVSSTLERDVDLLLRENFAFSCDLWDWCARSEARLIYASSAATYGDGAQGFLDSQAPEHLARLKPLTPYAWTKHAFDRRAARQAAQGGALPRQWVGLKLFNVYGPNEYHKGPMRSVVHQIFPEVAAGRPARLFASERPGLDDGAQSRDFIHVRDCVDVVLWFLGNPQISGLFNLGTGQARSFADLARAVFKALDRPPEIVYRPMPAELRGRYQYRTEARMEKLRAAGYDAPFLSLEDGVADYVRNHLLQPDPYR